MASQTRILTIALLFSFASQLLALPSSSPVLNRGPAVEAVSEIDAVLARSVLSLHKSNDGQAEWPQDRPVAVNATVPLQPTHWPSTSQRRALSPGLDAELHRVCKANRLKWFFWTGRMMPGTKHSDSVKKPVYNLAAKLGGTALWGLVQKMTVPPPANAEEWDHASDVYASYATGDVIFVQGDSSLPTNIWERVEFPRIKREKKAKRVFKWTMSTGQRITKKVQIWPECVDLADRTATCPAGAKLYYGSPTKPLVTAKTTIAKDGKAKVAAGSAAGITRACTQLLDGAFVKGLMETAGSCTADATVIKKLKDILSSAQNRHYIQQQRILPLKTELASDSPSLSKLKRSPLDALVAIDFYEQTRQSSHAVAQQIDTLLKTATGTSPGVAAAWGQRMSRLTPIKATLLALVQKQIADKQKQAKATQTRAQQCAARPGGARLANARRLVSPARGFVLTRRGPAQAPRSGPRAPAAPSCPLPKGPQKKIVPQSQTKPRPPAAKRPRVPATRPAGRPPNPAKRVVPRPATRARRMPGKTAPRKRATPRRKPKVIPKPTRKPKGRARGRKTRR